MLTDNEVSKLIDPICTIYQQIEYDLIVDIANRLATYDKADGVLEYRLKKLQEFQKITPELLKIFAKYSGKSEAEIKKLITEAQGLNIDLEPLKTAYDRDIIAVDPVVAMQSPILREIAELSYKDLSKTFSLIQTKAVESAKQAYINTLNTAYVEVASGNYSLQESLKKGLQRMARRGITGATYKRKNVDGSYTYTEYSIEGVIRRDTVTAVHQLANKSSLQLVKEIGADYVEISSHLGARTHPTNPIANHAGWQGGIFKIEGHDKKHRNLKEATGYPDDILGLGGVNCRHRMFAFIPGISKPNPIKYGDTEENKRIYKATQEQRLKERQIRKLKKEIAAIKPLGDKDATKALQIKLKNRQAELQAHCDKYGLKRDYSRELVQEQVAKTRLTKSTKNGNVIGARTSYGTELKYNPNAIYKIDVEEYSDEVNKGLSQAAANVANAGYKDNLEHLELINLDTGVSEYQEVGTNESVGGSDFWKYIGKASNSNKRFMFVHNHNDSGAFSETDLTTLCKNNIIKGFMISRFDGTAEIIQSNGKYIHTTFLQDVYKAELENINKLSRAGVITAGERTRMRENMLVNNAIRDYTKGLLKWNNGQRIQ